MFLVDTLIKKVEELIRIVNRIQSSSKKIHELPEISGEVIYVAASNGTQSGKFALSNSNSETPNISGWKNINLSPSSVFFLDDENNSYNFVIDNDMWSNVTPNIKGFNGNQPSDGLIGYVRNGSSQSIVLKHNVTNNPNVIIPFYLSSQTDYQINPNEILNFKYSKERNQCELSVYSSQSLVALVPKVEVFNLTESDVSEPNISLKLTETPSTKDFTTVYINGVFVNPDNLIMFDNLLVIAKSNIEYPIKSGMKVTVNYKY